MVLEMMFISSSSPPPDNTKIFQKIIRIRIQNSFCAVFPYISYQSVLGPRQYLARSLNATQCKTNDLELNNEPFTVVAEQFDYTSNFIFIPCEANLLRIGLHC